MTEQPSDFSSILAVLKENPRGMSVTEIAEAVHLNRNTIARYMDTLRVSGQVEMRTFGKAKVFFISKRVPVSAMLNLSSEMVLLIDDALKIIQANDTLLSFLSVSDEDIVGKYVYDGPCSIFCSEMLTEHIREALRGETVHDNLRLFRDSRECYLDQRIYPMALPDGKPGVSVVFDDITESVNAATALEQSESMFRRLVETIHDAIWSLDENFLIHYISPQIANICGYTSEEMVGKKFSEFMPKGAASRFVWELTSEVSRTHGFTLIDFPFIKKDGTKIYCEFSGTPSVLSEDPEMFLGYNGAIRDVTDRRNAEQGVKRWKLFLDGVMDNNPGSILVADKKTGKIFYLNHSAELLFQMSRNELFEKTIADLYETFGTRRLLDAYDQVVAFGKPTTVAEEKISKNGDEISVSGRILPMILSADREYILTILSDISDEITERNRQTQTRELAFILEGVSSTNEIWNPAMEILPKITGFESVAIFQRSIFDDYILFSSRGGQFAPAIPKGTILDRVIRKGEPVIFDKHRMTLFPEGTLTIMEHAKSLILMPVVHESRTVACVILGSAEAKSPDTTLRGLIISTAFQISTVASRCLVQEKLQRERDRTKSYLDIAGVLLVAVRRDGVIEMINTYGAELLGYTEAELLGKNWFELLVPENCRKERFEAFERLIAGQLDALKRVYCGPVLLSDGTEKILRWRNSLLREDCGSVAAVVSSGELAEKERE